MRDFHLLDSRWAVIIAHVSLTLPFTVWLMLTFFSDLPKELEQSAMLDGCNPCSGSPKSSCRSLLRRLSPPPS